MSSPLPRYRLGRLLKKGGVAEVYEGWVVGEAGFERKIAIKRLAPGDESSVPAFHDEARIASRLQHSNIVSVLDYGVMENQPFLVLELIDGFDLGDLLAAARAKGESVPPEIALHVAIEVGRALEYAHQARGPDGKGLGVVHRDVSPGNVLVSFAGEVKLSDFGIALFADRLERTAVGVVKGKRGYMAPEQALGEAVDARADIFALGCVLHFLLCGESPLDDPDAQDSLLRGAEPTLDTALPADLRGIVARATRRRPDQRHQDAAEFVEEASDALFRLVKKDPRNLLKAYLGKLKLEAARPTRTPLEEMVDLALVLDEDTTGIRRFITSPPRPPTESMRLEGPNKQTHLDTMRIRERKELASIAEASSESGQGSGSDRQPSKDGDDKLVGTVLHGYRLMEVLGKGALARVYRAEHLVLAREYAVKILYGRAAESERSHKRLEREAITLSRLVHPNIVTVIDYGFTEDGRPFLTMELLRGRTLSAAIKSDGPFSGDRAAHVARQISRALELAHQKNVVHRDLKPGNVMLMPQADGRELAKVLDFGIARLGDHTGTRLTSADMLLGTPRYMAPEQIAGASDVGPAADLYALGTVLYTMLSGRPPFLGKTLDVVEKQLREPPQPLSTKTGLESLVLQLLEKKPENRPQSAIEVIRAIDAIGFADPGPTVALTSFAGAGATVVGPPAHASSSSASMSNDVPSWTTTSPVLVPPARRASSLPAVVGAAGVLVAGLVLSLVLVRNQGQRQGVMPTTQLAAQPPPGPDPNPSAVAIPTARNSDPPPPPPPEAAPEPPSERPRNRPPPANPPPAAKNEPSLDELQKNLRQELRARGLSSEDAAALPGLESERARFESMVKAKDESGARNAYNSLLQRVRSVEADQGLVELKLKRIANKLKSGRGSIPQAEFDALENRYLDLLSNKGRDLSGAAGIARLRELMELEAEIGKAR